MWHSSRNVYISPIPNPPPRPPPNPSPLFFFYCFYVAVKTLQDLQQVMVSGPNLNETSIVSGGYGGTAEGIIPTSSIKGRVPLHCFVSIPSFLKSPFSAKVWLWWFWRLLLTVSSISESSDSSGLQSSSSEITLWSHCADFSPSLYLRMVRLTQVTFLWR